MIENSGASASTRHHPRAGRTATDDVAGGADKQSVKRIADRRGPGGIRANEIALHQVAGRRRTDDIDPFDLVAGDDVARAGRRAADQIARRIVDVDTINCVP